MDRQELAARKRADQKGKVAEATKAMRAAGRAANTDELVADMLAHRERQAGHLSAFPQRSERYGTPDLAAAAEAAEPKPIDQLSDDQIAAADALWQRLHTNGSRQTPDRSPGQAPGPKLSVVGNEPLDRLDHEPGPSDQARGQDTGHADDRDLALALLADTGRLSRAEAGWLIQQLLSPSFRLLLELSKEEAAALVSDLRATAVVPSAMEA